MGENTSRIDQAIRFLSRYAPGDLAKLQADSPIELVPDIALGGQEPKALTAASTSQIEAIQLKAVYTALSNMASARSQVLETTRRRIKVAGLLGLCAALLGIISTGTIITVLAKDYPKPVAYLAAVLNLAALLLSPIANYLLGVQKASGTDIYALNLRLWQLEDQANALLPQIEFCVHNPCEEDVISSLIGTGNKLLADTREALIELGG